MIDASKSIEACAAYYGDEADAMKAYLVNGEKNALALGNRGPIAFDENGDLSSTIKEAYSKNGFYIFESVLNNEEVEDIKEDLENLRQQFPTGPESTLNAKGEPAMNAESKSLTLVWSKPLGDPLGGTELANGRHQIKMFEPEAKEDAPMAVPLILLGSLQFSDACLRTYAHPKLLKVAESINGKDFAPFNEALFIKEPGIGAAVSWHQDGVTHWESESFDEEIHGFNFMAQVYGSTAVNGVWVVPGTHKVGKIDIKKIVAETGSERIDGAVPIVCNPGDVVICNRQLLHGSFPNCGFEPRVTVNFGFHKRSSVIGTQGGGIHSEAQVFDDEIIERRSRSIGYAIEARKQKYPNEEAYKYYPFEQSGKSFVWNDSSREDLKDYNLEDLSI
jgi:ectoine hydroxylase-related dioxygenase (phytanoyl-CoA dioxygenase family)|tara:strand:- start:347 stop:1516 length:1170 start_codon:yes stop_codon:yes gene_type:complete